MDYWMSPNVDVDVDVDYSDGGVMLSCDTVAYFNFRRIGQSSVSR
jgi:hypothetical protein